MWHKGYLHYHTGFSYPEERKVNAEELREEFKALGASFVFCAGDHGDNEGRFFWGWGEEYQDYYDLCATKSTNDFFFIPSLEIHLRFSEPPRRKEHHACIPGMVSLQEVGLSTPQSYPYVSLTRDPENFVLKTEEKKLSPIINHPHLSTICFFNGPDPRKVPAFYNFSYLELFTADWPNCFWCDFDLYLKFLSDPRASAMACCSGIDNALRPTGRPSSEPGKINATYLYIPNGVFTKETLLKAWNDRQTYAVHGNLLLDKIYPIPSRNLIRTTNNPSIYFSACHQMGEKIIKAAIYRNGISVYENNKIMTSSYAMEWEDREPQDDENHYIIHLETEAEEHLVTSPINYLTI